MGVNGHNVDREKLPDDESLRQKLDRLKQLSFEAMLYSYLGMAILFIGGLALGWQMAKRVYESPIPAALRGVEKIEDVKPRAERE